MVDVTQLGFNALVALVAIFLVCILYMFLRAIFLGKCSRCGKAKSLGGNFCIKCGAQYE